MLQDKGDLGGAIRDYSKAIRLKPDHASAFYNRGIALQDKGDIQGAIVDLQKYVDLGGGARDGDQLEVEKKIRHLRKALLHDISRKALRHLRERKDKDD